MAFLKELYDAYKKGQNINKYIQENKNSFSNSQITLSDSIALSYDLQAGSYLRYFYKNYEKLSSRIDYMVNNIDKLNLFNEINKKFK